MKVLKYRRKIKNFPPTIAEIFARQFGIIGVMYVRHQLLFVLLFVTLIGVRRGMKVCCRSPCMGKRFGNP
jgi:hypothetical protein